MSYATVNGLSLYYEEHGGGESTVLLLHGGLGTVEMMSTVTSRLAEGRRVIGVDLQAHGRTADVDRPMRFESMADDIAGLIGHLGVEPVDVMGYSLGGGVALRTAIQHPELVRRLVLVSTPYRRTGWYSEVLEGMAGVNAAAADAMKGSPMYETYAQVAPRVQDWPVLLEKTGALLKVDYDWSADIFGLTMPVMLMYGDADLISPTHAAGFYALLGGGQGDPGWEGTEFAGPGRTASRLAILPGTTHYEIVSRPELAEAVAAFLDESTVAGAAAG